MAEANSNSDKSPDINSVNVLNDGLIRVNVARPGRRIDAEIYALRYLHSHKELTKAEKDYIGGTGGLIEKLNSLADPKNEEAKKMEESKKGLTSEEWKIVEKLFFKVRNAQEKQNAEKETAEQKKETLKTKTQLYQLYNGILEKRYVDIPKEAEKSELEGMLAKNSDSYLTAYAADLFQTAKDTGIYKKDDSGHNKDVNKEVIMVDSFDKKFESYIVALQKNKITVGQIADLDKEKDYKKRTHLLLSLIDSDDTSTNNFDFSNKGVEFQKQALITGLLVTIYKRALDNGTLKQLLLQKALKNNNKNEIELIQADSGHYARETPVGEAMMLLLTAHEGDRSQKILMGIINGAKKSFGKGAGIIDRLGGAFQGIMEEISKLDLTSGNDEEVLSYLTQKYGNDNPNIDIQKMGKALIFIGKKEIDVKENDIFMTLEKNNISLTTDEKKIITDLIGGGEKQEGNKDSLRTWMGSMLDMTPETKQGNPNIFAKFFASMKNIEPIKKDFLEKWNVSATIDDTIMLDSLRTVYEQQYKEGEKTDARESVELMILGVLAIWMKKHEVQGADVVGDKVGKEMTKRVLYKVGGLISKVDIDNLDLDDRTQASLAYATEKHHIATNGWDNVAATCEQIGTGGKRVWDFLPWQIKIGLFAYVGGINALSSVRRKGKTAGFRRGVANTLSFARLPVLGWLNRVIHFTETIRSHFAYGDWNPLRTAAKAIADAEAKDVKYSKEGVQELKKFLAEGEVKQAREIEALRKLVAEGGAKNSKVVEELKEDIAKLAQENEALKKHIGRGEANQTPENEEPKKSAPPETPESLEAQAKNIQAHELEGINKAFSDIGSDLNSLDPTHPTSEKNKLAVERMRQTLSGLQKMPIIIGDITLRTKFESLSKTIQEGKTEGLHEHLAVLRNEVHVAHNKATSAYAKEHEKAPGRERIKIK